MAMLALIVLRGHLLSLIDVDGAVFRNVALTNGCRRLYRTFDIWLKGSLRMPMNVVVAVHNSAIVRQGQRGFELEGPWSKHLNS